MLCPNCKTPTGIIDSRTTETAQRRRRQCPSCSTRFTTYEVLQSDLQSMTTIARITQKSFSHLRRLLAEAPEIEDIPLLHVHMGRPAFSRTIPSSTEETPNTEE